MKRHVIAVFAIVALVVGAALAITSTNQTGTSDLELVAADEPTVEDWPGADTLAQDEAALEYAAALHEHRQVEWAAAAEAARVIEAQRAEEARQEAAREAQRRSQARTVSTAPQRSQSTPQVHQGGSCSALPAYISQRESGCNYGAVNPTGCSGRGCYGAYQFDPVTWNNVAPSIGITSPASGATPAEQDAVAAALWNGGAGCSHWAACG